MEGYSVVDAAKMLQVSRQTLYRYIDKEPGRYTVTTGDGQRRITIQGIGLLREQIKKPVTGANVTTNTGRQNLDISLTALQNELLQARHQVELLQVQLDAANVRITGLENDKASLENDKAGLFQLLHEQTQKALPTPRPGFIARLFGKSEQKQA